MAPKDIARSYPKRGLTADVGFRSEPKFCGDGSTNFNGSSDFATATTYDGGGTETTMVYWFKANSTALTTMPFANGGASNSRNQLQTLITSGTLRAADAPTNIPFSIDANRWYMLAIVGDSGGLKKAYLDGVDGGAPVAYGHSITATSLTLGARTTGPLQPFNGKLARFRIFNVELTQDQIRELYNNPGLDVPTGLTSSNLRRNYELETDFNDSGADSENATASGSPSFTVDRPQLPRGLDLARGAAMARVYTGRALDQDGSVDRLQGTNFTDATATACTVSFWMYQRDGGPGRIIHNFGGGATAVDRFIAFMSSSSFYIAGEITSGNRLGFTLSSLPLNQWHHVVFVLDGNGTTSLNTTILYLNGEKYDSPGAVGVIWDTTTFDIGGTSHGYQNQLIAGVKVFNTKLTDAQARELYHNPEQVLPTGVSASNLRRYYPLSDYNDTGGTGGRYFQDMGADGEPLEDIGSCSMEFAQPVPCPQLGLQQSATRLFMNGLSSNKATVTLPSAPGSSFSFQLWVNMKSVNSNYALEYGDPTVAGDALAIRIVSGTIGTYDTTARLSGLTISEGEWTHIVMATSDSSPYWRCWVNGSEASSPTALTGVRTGTSTSLTIGASPTFAQPTDGTISNCAFWTTQLDTPDVAALYNSGDQNVDVSTVQPSSLVGWWKCDDFTKFKNYANPGTADATVTGSPIGVSFPENASGSTIVGDFSMKRKGVSVLNFFSDPSTIDSSAVIPAQESVFPAYPGGYTFSAFFKLIKRGAFSTIFYSTDTSVANQLGVFGSSSGIFQIDAGDGGTVSTRVRVSAVTAITDSDWHHFAVTITHGTPTTTKVYIDGALDVTDTSFTQTGAPTPSDIVIGDYPSGSNEARGPIACFRTYQVPLSDNEIEQIYRSDLRLIKGLENE